MAGTKSQAQGKAASRWLGAEKESQVRAAAALPAAESARHTYGRGCAGHWEVSAFNMLGCRCLCVAAVAALCCLATAAAGESGRDGSIGAAKQHAHSRVKEGRLPAAKEASSIPAALASVSISPPISSIVACQLSIRQAHCFNAFAISNTRASQPWQHVWEA